MGQLEKRKNVWSQHKSSKKRSICDLAVEGVNSGSKVEREKFSENKTKQNKTKHGNPTYENVNSEDLARMKLSHF